jgi:hypothetical protein
MRSLAAGAAFVAGAILLCSLPAAAQEDVKVDAVLSATRIGLGESTVLQISIETRGAAADAIAIPDLPPGLEVTGSQDFNQLQVSFPGSRSRLIRRDVILRAHVPGDFIIPAVTVRVGRETFRTEALSLFVEPRRRAGGNAPPPDDGAEIRLRAWLEPDTVYVGQQLMFNAEAAFPRDLRQRQSRPATYEAPTPSNFWIQDLPDAVSAGMRSVNGEVFETQTFRRAYFPLQPGRYTFPPARLVYEIRRGFLFAPESRELVSDSMRVVVLPVPAAGRPASFNGAVGRFSVQAELQPRTVPAGEAATLTVEVEGAGNVKALPAPRLALLDGVEVYPPSEESRLTVTGDEVAGVKRFTWVLVPEATGRVEIPALEYAYFDPARGAFQVSRTPPLALRVTAARASGSRTLADTAIRGLAARPTPPRFAWVRSPLFALTQLVPLVILAGVVLLRRGDAADGWRARRRIRDARAGAFDALRRAAGSAESDRVFFGDLAAALRGAIADVLGEHELRGSPREALIAALQRHHAPADTVDALDRLFARIDRARFASSSAPPAERSALVADARRLMDAIDAAVTSARRRRPSAVGVVLLLAFVPGIAAAQSTTEFRTGVTAFAQADYDQAIRAFADHLSANALDANGWYNLGNAYLRSGRAGHAVWAWLRAAELEPRRDDVRHNLSAIGADAALAALPSRLTLSADEALLGISALWWIAALGTAVLLAARRAGSAWFVGGAATIALAIAALALPPLLRGPTAITLQDRAELLGGPSIKAENIATLVAGEPVRIRERREGWIRVETAEGREGWIEAEFVVEL